IDSGETALTDPLGDYRFAGVRPGSYTLRELLPAGWEQSRPVGGVYRLTVTSGQVLTREDFGDFQRVSLSGQVFLDDGNHVKDPGEAGLAAWVVHLDKNNNGALDPDETT